MKTLFLIAAMLSSVSCALISPDNTENTVPGEAEEIVLTKAQSEMTVSANDLGFKVFSEIEKSDPLSDRFISPLSLSLALAMTAQGASGNTQKEMLSVLGFDGYTAGEMGGYYKTMTEGLAKADKTVNLAIANAIWANRLISVKKDFVSDARKYFNSEVNTDDFSKKSTLSDINDWCSENTNGKIPSILDELSNDLMMVLLNALYFKGSWTDEFDAARTGTFTAIDGTKTKTKLMSRSGSYMYAENADFQIVEIPYGNGAFVMDLMLPLNAEGYAKAAATLNAESWNGLVKDLSTESVSLTMPVFKSEYTVELSDALKALGMRDAFSGEADFSAMSTTPLCIDFVKQKTYVDVSEKGTEAAAVTAVGMKCMCVGPTEQKIFRADRPFVYAIRETSTGAVLFLGQKMK